MKIDPYKNDERWTNWKTANFNKTPTGIRKADWNLLVDFLKDMELGLNTPTGMKGKRSAGTLLNLSSHNRFFLTNFNKPLLKLTKQDLHKLEAKVETGVILKQNGKKYSCFGNYIKDFKPFWNWLVRTKRVSENICEDISSKTDKPAWVYLTDEQVKNFFNKFSFDYRVICFFFYDTGCRVTEGLNVQIKDFSNDFSQVTIKEEASKTFERTINLKLCSSLVKEYVKENNLTSEDYLISKQPFGINKYLRYHALKIFGDKISHPKAKGNYKTFTLYDIRHNSACFWFNKYPTHKGLMYRMGWRKADKIEYYSNFLGVSDELDDSDMIVGEDKSKLVVVSKELEDMKKQMATILGLTSIKEALIEIHGVKSFEDIPIQKK